MSFEEHIMSEDKCPGIFSCQMEVIVFIVPKIVFCHMQFWNFIGEYHSVIPQC